jgi:hypothetical protein
MQRTGIFYGAMILTTLIPQDRLPQGTGFLCGRMFFIVLTLPLGSLNGKKTLEKG